jgi:glucuronoarabinoxylan endo-1,4-beta-xylanase
VNLVHRPSIPRGFVTTPARPALLKRSTRTGAVLGSLLGLVGCSDAMQFPSQSFTPPPPAPTATVPPPVEPPPQEPAPVVPPEVVVGDLDQPSDEPAAQPEPTPPEEPEEEPTVIDIPSVVEPRVDCAAVPNNGSLNDGDINVNLATEFQTIFGFGGINVPGWIDDLTPEQVDTAFGRGPGQLGLTILRVRVPFDSAEFEGEVPSAQRAVSLGARVMASPWTPPPALKTNNDIVAGELEPENYGAYADHLMSFRDLMAFNGVPLEAISVQNEPDIEVDYESCDWTSAQLADFLREQGPRFGDTKLIAAESFNFNRQLTDPLLNDAAVAAQFEIVGGHIYGNGLSDYPLARQLGKQVWMTEHLIDSNVSANEWPNALAVGVEIHDSMQANFNAYLWWYIRRSYGPITEDGQVSKRGFLMSQYARFVRPGFIRVGASQPQVDGVEVSAFKNGNGKVVVVAVNSATATRNVNLDVFGSCVQTFDRFTTSQTKNVADDGDVTLNNGRAGVTLDAQSVTTFVSQ